MNSHDIMWDSCKRSVPEVSLIKENTPNDFYSARPGFPLCSTPPNGRAEMAVKPASDLKNSLTAELNLLKTEIINEIRQNPCQCMQEKPKQEHEKVEILREISQQLMELKMELAAVKQDVRNLTEKKHLSKVVDKEVQIDRLVSEQSTQTSNISIKPDYVIKTPLPVQIQPEQGDVSMTANKILQKYLPDEPKQHSPRWRQTEYENLIFNMTNVSVAMQRPTRNEFAIQSPCYEDNWPYSPKMDYRQPEPIRRVNDYPEPEPDWWSNRPRPKLIDLSAIMNQPKLL